MANAKEQTKPKSRLSRFRSKWFSKLPDEKSVETKISDQVDEDRGKEDIGEAFQSLDWDLSEDLGIMPYIGRIGEIFRQRGIAEGAKGVAVNGLYRIITAKVQILVGDLEAILRGERERLKARVEGLAIVAEMKWKKWEHANKVIDRKRRHPRKFSRLLAIFYLIIAFIMILADIPLAIKLMEEGFNFTIAKPNISQLFNDPIGVLSANWEIILISLGIALSSVYVKIFYDEYIGGALSRKATMIEDEVGIDPLDELKSNAIRRAYRFRLIVKVSILLLTLSTIVVLGYFRFDVMSALYGIDPSTKGLAHLSGGITKASFILITLLFPIIGGVCFSLSLNHLLNYKEYFQARVSIKRNERDFIKARESFDLANSQIEKIKVYIDRVNSPEFEKRYRDFLLSSYGTGYERGQMAPDSAINESDLYGMVERMRKKVVARQVMNTIRAANQQEKNVYQIFDDLVELDRQEIIRAKQNSKVNPNLDDENEIQ